jgi:hypothetical protein
MYVGMRIHGYTYDGPDMYTHPRVRTAAPIHTDIDTYIHTYIHTYTHTYMRRTHGVTTPGLIIRLSLVVDRPLLCCVLLRTRAPNDVSRHQ